MAFGLALVRVVVDVRRLGWLLRTFPGGPGFALDAVKLSEFPLSRFIEVPDGRLAPLFADLDEVVRRGRLADVQLRRNLCLGPSLDVEISDLLASLDDAEFLATADCH